MLQGILIICQTPLLIIPIFKYRVFNSFTLEVILASAFGRSIDIQRGEADDLTKAVKSIFVLFQEGQKMSLDMILMLYSMSNHRYYACI